ncbi:MAG: anr [Verrucomicrobiales bacterium]|nr:anr [Verrucomicrobiales bacterium]
MINDNLRHRQTAIINTLRNCPLLAGLPPEEINQIASFSFQKLLSKGQYLFREADLPIGFYIVQSGAINLHRVNGSGKEQIIHIFRSGESFAEGTLVTEGGFSGDARALEPSQVILVRKCEFLGLIKRQPEIALRVLSAMNIHLSMAIAQLENLMLNDVEHRVADWLIQRCPNPESVQPTKIELRMTKRTLAAELGTVSETLSRTLAKFRQRDLVYVNGKSVTLLNPSRMVAELRGGQLARV